MSNVDIVKAGIAAWCAAQWDSLSGMLTDDFTFSDGTNSLDRDGFIGLGKTILTAFPDWDFHAHDFVEAGDTVTYTATVTGTHKGELALIPDVPPVAATGKSIHLKDETHIYTIRANQISHLKLVIADDGGGFQLYAQVGAPLG